MAIIDYDKSPAISETQRLKSLKESVQRAFDEVDNRFAETSAENTSQNKMIEKLAADVKSGGGGTVVGNVSWSDITGKPSTFNPSAHTHVTKKTYEQWSQIQDSYVPQNGEIVVYTTYPNDVGIMVFCEHIKLGDGSSTVSELPFVGQKAMSLLHTLTIGNIKFDGSSDETVPIYDGDYE